MSEADHLAQIVMPMLEDGIEEKQRYKAEGEELAATLRQGQYEVPWFCVPHIWWLRLRVWWYSGVNERRLNEALYLREKVRRLQRDAG